MMAASKDLEMAERKDSLMAVHLVDKLAFETAALKACSKVGN
jgi:hypothetical protein